MKERVSEVRKGKVSNMRKKGAQDRLTSARH